jgi:hypothetical protein
MRRYYLGNVNRNEDVVVGGIDKGSELFQRGRRANEGAILSWSMPEEELLQILTDREANLAGAKKTVRKPKAKPEKDTASDWPYSRQSGASGRFCSGRRQGQSYGGEVIYR